MPTALERINEQETQPGAVGVLATITQSGCTNTCGYNIEIHNDGSATGVTIGTINSLVTKQDFPPGTIDTKDLQNLLTEIGDVSKILTGSCMKPVSFATTTKITYAGKTSGDLQCIQQPATGGDQTLLHESEHLARLVLTILVQLKFDDRLIIPNK
ncbi:MAG: hypothetical protein ABSG62_14055 [Terracidiphilus sp.]